MEARQQQAGPGALVDVTDLVAAHVAACVMHARQLISMAAQGISGGIYITAENLLTGDKAFLEVAE